MFYSQNISSGSYQYNNYYQTIDSSTTQDKEAIPSNGPSLQELYANGFDDVEGMHFTHFVKLLNQNINETIKIIDKEKSLSIFKCMRLAETIKNNIRTIYDDNSFEFFLAAFQVCTTVPDHFKNLTWQFLIQKFKNISLKQTSPLIHTLHELTFARKHSYKNLLSFLNILSFIYAGEKSMDIERKGLHLICPVEMSVLRIRNQNNKVSVVSAIHLKTISHSYTLNIPLNIYSAMDNFFNEKSHDLMAPSLPKLIIMKNIKSVLLNLINQNFFNSLEITQFANHLIKTANDYLRNLGYRVLLSINNNHEKVDLIFMMTSLDTRRNLARLACLELIINKVMLLPSPIKFKNENDIYKVKVIFKLYLDTLSSLNKRAELEYLKFFNNNF